MATNVGKRNDAIRQPSPTPHAGPRAAPVTLTPVITTLVASSRSSHPVTAHARNLRSSCHRGIHTCPVHASLDWRRPDENLLCLDFVAAGL